MWVGKPVERVWETASAINSSLVTDPTIRQPGFDLPRREWSLLNRFCTAQGHCRACWKMWRLADDNRCQCGEIQTMLHMVETCPFTKFEGGLTHLHSADESTVKWLTSFEEWSHTITTTVDYAVITVEGLPHVVIVLKRRFTDLFTQFVLVFLLCALLLFSLHSTHWQH